MPNRTAAILTTALAPLIWGSTYLVTTEFLPPNRPFTAALIRVLPAGLLLLAWTRRLPRRGEWGIVALLGFLNIGFFQAMLFVAAYRLPGGLAAVRLGMGFLVFVFQLARRSSEKWDGYAMMERKSSLHILKQKCRLLFVISDDEGITAASSV